MTDRPIIFSAPMVRALLDGRKTQTRRVLGNSGPGRGRSNIFSAQIGWSDSYVLDPGNANWRDRDTPYAPGDRLWVREGGELLHDADDWNGVDRWHVAGWRYADGTLKEFRDFGAPLSEWVGDCSPQKRSPIFMPRWASRLTLLVTDVRVQRLQEISDRDALAEGVEGSPINEMHWKDYTDPKCWILGSPKHGYRTLWNSIHGPDAWDANPWVAAISFETRRCNIDTMEEGTW